VSLKDPGFLRQLRQYRPDLQIVIAFRMLPETVWALPPLGTFNLHASLLPQYRGAAPINHAIMNGETVTGVTTFFINDRIDTGRILLAEQVTIAPDETAGELHDRLMKAGAELVLRTVAGIIAGSISETPQELLVKDPASLHTAPKIFREDCRINWNREANRVHDFIRGLSPVPGAYTDLPLKDGTLQNLKILRAFPEHSHSPGTPGEFLTDGKTCLKVRVADGFIHLAWLQPAGRKPMSCGDFLRGFGWIFPETRGI
jgi:methionyl-tRNA formyltransferase